MNTLSPERRIPNRCCSYQDCSDSEQIRLERQFVSIEGEAHLCDKAWGAAASEVGQDVDLCEMECFEAGQIVLGKVLDVEGVTATEICSVM